MEGDNCWGVEEMEEREGPGVRRGVRSPKEEQEEREGEEMGWSKGSMGSEFSLSFCCCSNRFFSFSCFFFSFSFRFLSLSFFLNAFSFFSFSFLSFSSFSLFSFSFSSLSLSALSFLSFAKNSSTSSFRGYARRR